MSRPFVLPDLGEGLVEAEIVRVLVKEGELVREDAPLLEVETDKAQVEIPSPMSGRVEKIHVAPHQTVHVGEVLVTFADGAAPPAAQPKAAASAVAAPIAPAATPSQPSSAAPVREGPVPATPSTRRLARELGVDLRAVRGSGSGGRVTDDDVRAAASRPAAADGHAAPRAPAGPQPAAAEREVARPLASIGLEPPPLPKFEQWGPVERRPLSHLRRTIAERMTLSATVVPH